MPRQQQQGGGAVLAKAQRGDPIPCAAPCPRAAATLVAAAPWRHLHKPRLPAETATGPEGRSREPGTPLSCSSGCLPAACKAPALWPRNSQHAKPSVGNCAGACWAAGRPNGQPCPDKSHARAHPCASRLPAGMSTCRAPALVPTATMPRYLVKALGMPWCCAGSRVAGSSGEGEEGPGRTANFSWLLCHGKAKAQSHHVEGDWLSLLAPAGACWKTARPCST